MNTLLMNLKEEVVELGACDKYMIILESDLKHMTDDGKISKLESVINHLRATSV